MISQQQADNSLVFENSLLLASCSVILRAGLRHTLTLLPPNRFSLLNHLPNRNSGVVTAVYTLDSSSIICLIHQILYTLHSKYFLTLFTFLPYFYHQVKILTGDKNFKENLLSDLVSSQFFIFYSEQARSGHMSCF